MTFRAMRNQLSKLQRGHSTKAERIFAEVLKGNHIPFRAKARIGNYEVDFLIRDKVIVELNGHDQSAERNNYFVLLGYVPIHISNTELKQDRNSLLNKLLCLLEQNSGMS